jgi:thioesterase domain-containing protein/acyl carrier protein
MEESENNSIDTIGKHLENLEDIKTELVKIWGNAFNCPVNLKDDFFALGGDSLKAAELFTQVHKIFGIKLPINTVFNTSTLEQMADLIYSNNNSIGKGSSIPDPVIILKSGSQATPLFCIHGVNGNLMHYDQIIEQINDIQIYGIQPRKLDGVGSADSVESMASSYVKIIKAVQPRGPYNLLGYSFGGIVAYEIATQLVNSGEKINFLGVIDVTSTSEDFWDLNKMFSPVVVITLVKEMPSLISSFIFRDVKFRKKILSNVKRFMYYLYSMPVQRLKPKNGNEIEYPFWIEDNPAGYLRDTARKNYRIARRYIPKKYDGKMVLFSAVTIEDMKCIYRKADPDMGWDSFAREIEVIFIKGDHESILVPPDVNELSIKIEEYLVGDMRSKKINVVKNVDKSAAMEHINLRI